MFQILIVDDDEKIRRYFSILLSQGKYKPYTAASAAEALKIMGEARIDLILLDVTMPEMNGYDFAKMLRQYKNPIPILMVTARCRPEDMRKGFLSGADDYMTKPVDEEELLLRIWALLRRAKIMTGHQLVVGDTALDCDTLEVRTGGKEYFLPKKEFDLLYKLLSHPERMFTRMQLLEEIWGLASDSMDATVSVHISRLRKRFEGNLDFRIITIRGMGYKAQINSHLQDTTSATGC